MNGIKASFFIAVNGQQKGPYDANAITEFINQGEIQRETLVWKAGMSNWAQVSTLPEFAGLYASIPPPIPSTPIQPTEEVNLPDGCPLMKSVREAIENHMQLLYDYAENSFFTSFVTKGHNQEVGIITNDGSICFFLGFDKPELIERLQQYPDYGRMHVETGYNEDGDLVLFANINLGLDVEHATKFIARFLRDILNQKENVSLDWEAEDSEADADEEKDGSLSNIFGGASSLFDLFS